MLTDDDALAHKVRSLCVIERFSARLDRMQSAFLAVKLPQLLTFIAARTVVAVAYSRALSGLSWLRLPVAPAGTEPSWQLYVVRCDHRDQLRAHLLACGVECLLPSPLLHLQHEFRSLGFELGSFPVAERLASTALSLPIASMTEQQVQSVIEAVRGFPTSSHWPK